MIRIESEIPGEQCIFTLTWLPELSSKSAIDRVRGLANDFRRIILSKIPTLAIHIIEIDDAESRFDDLNFTTRLELLPIPLSSPVNEWDLDISGPVRVSSRHLGLPDDITLCHLRRGEKIKLKAIAEYGTGQEHAKWSPVTTVKFEFVNFNCYRFTVGLTGTLTTNEIIFFGLLALEEKYGPLGIKIVDLRSDQRNLKN